MHWSPRYRAQWIGLPWFYFRILIPIATSSPNCPLHQPFVAVASQALDLRIVRKDCIGFHTDAAAVGESNIADRGKNHRCIDHILEAVALDRTGWVGSAFEVVSLEFVGLVSVLDVDWDPVVAAVEEVALFE